MRGVNGTTGIALVKSTLSPPDPFEIGFRLPARAAARSRARNVPRPLWSSDEIPPNLDRSRLSYRELDGMDMSHLCRSLGGQEQDCLDSLHTAVFLLDNLQKSERLKSARTVAERRRGSSHFSEPETR